MQIADGTLPLLREEDDTTPIKKTASDGATAKAVKAAAKAAKAAAKKKKAAESQRSTSKPTELTLQEALGVVSGGRVGGKKDKSTKERRDYRGSSGDDSDSDEASVATIDMEKRRRSHGKKRAAFWRDFQKAPFPIQTLPYDDREGENMLRAGLTNAPTLTAYVNTKTFQNSRNGIEARESRHARKLV